MTVFVVNSRPGPFIIIHVRIGTTKDILQKISSLTDRTTDRQTQTT